MKFTIVAAAALLFGTQFATSGILRADTSSPRGASAPEAVQDKPDKVALADLDFALEELEKQCGHFFATKDIDWKAVAKELRKDAKKVESLEDHHALLWRLLARLEDGHAAVQLMGQGTGIGIPEDWQVERQGPGLFFCKIGKKIYVKNVWNAAAEVNVMPGSEVIKIDGTSATKWLDARVEELSDRISFSTDHQAFFYACHWGLADEPNTRLKLEVKTPEGKKKKHTITIIKANPTPSGPAYFPSGIQSTKDLNYAKLESGYGYVHVRRCKGDLAQQMDKALADLGEVPGIILDFRGNSGGGFDHDDFYGRFVPKGETFVHNKSFPSTGPNPYGGPMILIVDATVRSAGETGSGMFKEDGRGYMIGESPTAGMSASKTTIELPSGLFGLYVSVASNKGRFQGGRGIEGIGIEPHEIVEFDPDDLAAKTDTLILRAEALLQDFPQKKVPYDPEDFGWGK